MIRLDRIYTGGGDQGETSQGDGSRVSKLHPRITAGGAVDELNCFLGMAVCAASGEFSDILVRIQQLLFDLGADLCVPPSPNEADGMRLLRMSELHVAELERLIDHFNEQLSPLNSFVLPGGTQLAAWLHLARAVCRRAEVEVIRLNAADPVNPALLVSLNRLSDLLFVMARSANHNGKSDVLWKQAAFFQASI
jgi:cob(I)alamin adenosyltransferase